MSYFSESIIIFTNELKGPRRAPYHAAILVYAWCKWKLRK